MGSKTAKQLREQGYGSVKSIATASDKELARRTDLGDKKAKKLIEAARELQNDLGFRDGMEIRKKQNKMQHITTGSKKLDDMFGGGIPTQMITEAYGKNSSGKSQLAQQLAVNVQLPPEKGGLGRGCVFIDTEDSYISRRIEQLAKAQGLDPDKVLDNIFVGKAYSSEHQLMLAERAQKKCLEHDIGIIVVDSIIAHFRSEYTGRDKLPERQKKLNNHLHTLAAIARTFNCAVFVTNQVMSDPGKLFGDPITPTGGNVMGHNATTRLYLRSSGLKNKKWKARLTDSPFLPQAQAPFKVTEKGIEDAD